MHGLDGHYRHHGTSIHWDEDGVTLDRGGRSTRLSWEDVLAVRRLGGHPGYVQLMVRDHVPRQRLSEDQLIRSTVTPTRTGSPPASAGRPADVAKGSTKRDSPDQLPTNLLVIHG